MKCLLCRKDFNAQNVCVVTCPCRMRFVHPSCKKQFEKQSCPRCDFKFYINKESLERRSVLRMAGLIKGSISF